MKRIALALISAFATVSPAFADAPWLRLFFDPRYNYVWCYWSTVPGAAAYDVRRTSAYPTWDHTNRVSGGSVSSTGEPVTLNAAYVYQVVPLDSNYNPLGPPSNTATVYASATFTDDPLAAGATFVKSVHVTEMRTFVNAIRAAAGLGAYSWSYPSLTGNSLIHAADIGDLRTAFDAALTNIGAPTAAWSDTMTSGLTVKKVHVQELRNRIRAFPNYEVPYSNGQSVSNLYFSPNGDGQKDTTTYSVNLYNATSESRFAVNVRRTATNSVVRTAYFGGASFSYAWDGKNGSGAVQPEGAYVFEVVDLDGLSTPVASMGVTLDLTPPALAISAPAAGTTISNVRMNGGGSVTVTGSATDAYALASWLLERTGNGQPNATINSGTAPVSAGGTLGTWSSIVSGDPIANGTYTLKLTGTDRAGNSATATVDITVAHFSASLAGHELNTTTAQTVAYTSIVPFPLTETITIRRASTNALVRTLFNGARAAQSYTDTWGGRDDAGNILGDGEYRYYVTVTDGTYTLTWDKSAEMTAGSGFTQYPYPTCRNDAGAQVACNDAGLTFDPYANKPLRINYCITAGDVATGCSGSGPATVIAKIVSTSEADTSCNTFNCIGTWVDSSGPHEIVWFGTSADGANLAPSGMRLLVLRSTSVAKNLVVLFGARPTIGNLTITPPMYNPAAGPQTFTVSVSSPAGRPITLSAQFRNITSRSILRTVTNPGPGGATQSISWDGKADNGMWVAPDFYEVTITATDSAGGTATLKPIVTVRY